MSLWCQSSFKATQSKIQGMSGEFPKKESLLGWIQSKYPLQRADIFLIITKLFGRSFNCGSINKHEFERNNLLFVETYFGSEC